jgi:hypothetical protein
MILFEGHPRADVRFWPKAGMGLCAAHLLGVMRTSTSAVESARCMSALSQDQAALLWRLPLYFDLARINLDSTTPAMMATATTRIVVRSMFIDYPSSR